MSQGGGGKGAALDEVLRLEDTMKPQQVEGYRMVRMAAEMLECHACHLPLKHSIFKCEFDDGHLLCSSCRGVHGESCGRPVARSTLAEAFAAAALVRCDYERYGCDAGDVVYHKAADHRIACHHAPCGCPESCGFSGSRKNLLEHVLAGEEDKDDPSRNAFLLSLTERGAEVEMSLVCIGADGGVPQFSSMIAVEHSDDGARRKRWGRR
ncbi:unnamed protein product [Alopecurus aequalis]